MDFGQSTLYRPIDCIAWIDSCHASTYGVKKSLNPFPQFSVQSLNNVLILLQSFPMAFGLILIGFFFTIISLRRGKLLYFKIFVVMLWMMFVDFVCSICLLHCTSNSLCKPSFLFLCILKPYTQCSFCTYSSI